MILLISETWFNILLLLMVAAIGVIGLTVWYYLQKSPAKRQNSWRIPIVHNILAMTDKEREAVREYVDAVIEGRMELHEAEITFLRIQMLMLCLSSREQKDAERDSQLKAICDDLQKRTTKLKLKCPYCGRSLKGATQAMIGDTGVCPKCKAEFVIEQKG